MQPEERGYYTAKTVFWWTLVVLLSLLPLAAIKVSEKSEVILNSVGANLNERLDKFSERLDARDKQVEKILTDVHDYAEQNYWDVYALNETAVTTARQFSEFTRKLDINVNGGEGQKGIMAEVHELLKQTREASIELEADLHKVLVSTDKTLKPLQDALTNVASLTSKLDLQVGKSGKDVDKLIVDLDKAISDVDKLLSDPNIAQTLANVQETTFSIDKAFRPWRERAHLLKIVLSKAVGVITHGLGTAVAEKALGVTP